MTSRCELTLIEQRDYYRTQRNCLRDRFDFFEHLTRQKEWSERTFGPGARAAGVVDHIVKELHEVLANPVDLSEWIDVVILALDGAWREGHSPKQIIDALVAKQTKNESRTWPDWRTAEPDKAIEHIRKCGCADWTYDNCTKTPEGHHPDCPYLIVET